MKGRPPARARSPPKTNLNSPARRAPGLSSSPLRVANVVHGSPSGAKSVQRRLDFKNNPLANRPVLPKPNGVKDKGKATATTNGHRSSPEEEDEEEEENGEESMAMLDGGGDDYGVEDEEDDGALELELERELEAEQAVQTTPPSAKKNRGRAKKAPTPVEEEEDDDEGDEEEDEEEAEEEAIFESIEEETEPAEDSEPVRAGKKRGRPPAKANHVEDDFDKPAKKKSKRNPDLGEEGGSSNDAAAPKRRGRPPKSATAEAAEGTEASIPTNKRAIPKQKRPLEKRTSLGVGDTSVAEVPRGPPLPRSRGLVITRRETPGAASMHTTRSGRTSYQPLAFWKNERAELDDEALLDDGKSKIVLPHIKEIVRIDELEPDQKAGSRRRGRPSGKKNGRRRGGFYDDDDDDDDLEEWEQDGDVILGEVVVWQPEHEFNPPGPDEQIEVAPDEQIAVSANAIMTREIRNASFKFAKTLSMPFFGSGVVDLPPGTEKKPKNSRKMHMTFFVFAGRVQVTVADTVFSIGRGGMWFVPRGKQASYIHYYYSLSCSLKAETYVSFLQEITIALRTSTTSRRGSSSRRAVKCPAQRQVM